MFMNAVGIDVSKGKSTVAVIQPFGIVIAEPFDVFHIAQREAAAPAPGAVPVATSQSRSQRLLC